MWQNTHLTKTDHCKYLREESLKNIHAAKKQIKKIEIKPTWSQSNATRSDAWQFSLLPVEQHFNSHQIQTYHQRKVRHKQILSSIDHKNMWDEHVT